MSPFGGLPMICPYLIPNPGNPDVPWLIWDLRLPPSQAKRIAPRAVVVSARDRFKDVAMHPSTPSVTIVYNATTLWAPGSWGPIAIDKRSSGGQVLFEDILDAIYDFFQTPLVWNEADAFKRDLPEAWQQMKRAFQRRCREFPGLSEVEHRNGMRRVDCLGDRYMFWGLWVTHNLDGTFQLNLGTVPKSKGVPMPPPVRRR